jgi:uncharacterized membrane protein YkvA (DUF1232 family)
MADYSDGSLFDKIKKSFSKAGAKVIYNVLLLYNILKHDDTSTVDKGIIIGALAYFILPIDAIPDFLIPLGYTDDLGVLVAALEKVRGNLNEDIRDKAKDDLDDFFGEDTQRYIE